MSSTVVCPMSRCSSKLQFANADISLTIVPARSSTCMLGHFSSIEISFTYCWYKQSRRRLSPHLPISIIHASASDAPPATGAIPVIAHAPMCRHLIAFTGVNLLGRAPPSHNDIGTLYNTYYSIISLQN